jgi:hypothetical protein
MSPEANSQVATPPAPVFTSDHPEYPFLVYNHKTRQTKAAKDADDKAKLAGQGFVDDPFPPEDPDTLTQAEVADLQKLLAKAAKALAKLGKISEEPAEEPGTAPAE